MVETFNQNSSQRAHYRRTAFPRETITALVPAIDPFDGKSLAASVVCSVRVDIQILQAEQEVIDKVIRRLKVLEMKTNPGPPHPQEAQAPSVRLDNENLGGERTATWELKWEEWLDDPKLDLASSFLDTFFTGASIVVRSFRQF